MRSLGEYAKVKSGFAFKSSWWRNKGIPVIKIGSISKNTIDYKLVDFVDENKLEQAKNYLAKEGDLVIAMTGATVGKIGIVPNFNSKILVNQRVGLFDLDDKPFKKISFFYFTLLNERIQNEIKNVGGDSAQANISNSQIENLKLVMPNNLLIETFNFQTQPIIKSLLNKIKQLQKLQQLQELLLTRMTREKIKI